MGGLGGGGVGGGGEFEGVCNPGEHFGGLRVGDFRV